MSFFNGNIQKIFTIFYNIWQNYKKTLLCYCFFFYVIKSILNDKKRMHACAKKGYRDCHPSEKITRRGKSDDGHFHLLPRKGKGVMGYNQALFVSLIFYFNSLHGNWYPY